MKSQRPSAMALLGLAARAVHEKNSETAIAHLREALSIEGAPTHPNIAEVLASLITKQGIDIHKRLLADPQSMNVGGLERSLALFDEAVGHDPENEEAITYAESSRRLLALAQMCGTETAWYRYQAGVAIKAGNAAEAIRLLEQGIAITHFPAPLHTDLSFILSELAIRAINQAVRSGDQEMFNAAAADGLRVLTRAVELDPSNDDAFRVLTMLKFSME